MRPVAPLNFLEANETTELAGIEIPKGTPVFLLTRPATLDDNNYKERKDFKPERWVGRRESGRKGTVQGRSCTLAPAPASVRADIWRLWK